MSVYLRIFLVIISVAFLAFVLRMVRNEKYMLKYALLWVVLGIFGVIVAVFPGIIYVLASALGFETPVNFVFLVVIALLLGMSLLYGAALSKQAEENRVLVQELSILRAEGSTHTPGHLATGDQLPTARSTPNPESRASDPGASGDRPPAPLD